MEECLRNASWEVMFSYRVKRTTSVPLRWRQHVEDGSSGLKYFILLLTANASHWLAHKMTVKPLSRSVSSSPLEGLQVSLFGSIGVFYWADRTWRLQTLTVLIEKTIIIVCHNNAVLSVSGFPVLTIRVEIFTGAKLCLTTPTGDLSQLMNTVQSLELEWPGNNTHTIESHLQIKDEFYS